MPGSNGEGSIGKADRKKSANWSDQDTDTLVNVLMRYKDTGRTTDYGFKLEVWQEAAGLLQNSTFVGGPKTAEACKSRWQRIQRDYRAAKEMETMPGVKWDRSTHRLRALPEAWDNAVRQLEPYKYARIHLPCYDALAILCAGDNPRVRARTRTRPSQASSDSGSMLSLSISSTTGQASANAMGGPMNGGHDGANGQMNMTNGGLHSQSQRHLSLAEEVSNGVNLVGTTGHGTLAQHTMTTGHGQMGTAAGLMGWEGAEEDGEGEFEASFTMTDTDQQQQYLVAPKRLSYDPSLMSTSTPNTHPQSHSLNQSQTQTSSISLQSRHSPTKRSRTSLPIHSSRSNIAPQPPPGPDSLNQSTHRTQSQHLSTPYFPLSQSHSPDFSASSTLMESMMPHHSPTSTTLSSAHMSSQNHSTLQPPPAFASPVRPPPLKEEVRAAGLSEAQRRTQAILELQAGEKDLTDEEMVDIVSEFSGDIALADCYLALKRSGLRTMFVKKLLGKRKR
ncbi:hypothetical protein M231_01839 [Tremella mesenterica]|uniref:Myb-like domain-containing protein n=1 Tax=Tremella mesenterica TaxID=5217 RepID=A0A4Q1BS65_TREME|nr:uncharacterized protein TREMEDRAFT_72684 [Tremella mesenterica DSM 1558]EIW72187.1 hypothetical protein TREMEDRAFT_72684 [Tremella mesenterica DSM 1558]RXK40780.1 hypothetical protein M231_01839 [Tremella mesenterica]